METKRPGGVLSNRPLHFIWILDVSGSMDGDKIQSLNYAIRNSIPAMKSVADENPNAEVLIRCITFGDEVKWHIGTAIHVADFEWQDVQAGGMTPMGKAMTLLADQLKIPPMSDRALPPVLVLITDGQPTDDFASSYNILMQESWAKKAVRLGIAIGEDADTSVIEKFIGNKEIKPLIAHNSEQLVNFIKWASTAVVKAASSPASQLKDEAATGNVPVGSMPDTSDLNQDVVW
jgi:uncharacterized protein YegL